MKDGELEAYCARIEHVFFRLKGRAGMLSPADFARASLWYRTGVPLDAALEGVTSAFDAHSAGRRGAVEEVNGLAFCEPFVETVLSRRRSRE